MVANNELQLLHLATLEKPCDQRLYVFPGCEERSLGLVWLCRNIEDSSYSREVIITDIRRVPTASEMRSSFPFLLLYIFK